MATNSKLIESFRTKIKGIFKESAELEDPLDQRPGPDGKPTMPPKPTSKPPILEAEDVPAIPPAEGGAEVDPTAPPVEEEKVTMTVSLLKSLLDWAHGEEEAEGEGEEGEAGAEVAPEATPVAPMAEAEAVAGDPAAPMADPADGLEGEGMEDAGVEAIEIQALVDKVKELAQTKGELTDEDFGEIVAAAEAAEGDAGGGDSLEGIMGDEAAVPEAPITENIGEVIPKGAKFKNEGNKGIGK